jgi:hypothetical protein
MTKHWRYGDGMYPDNLTHAGANDLANRLRLFWAAKGHFPKLTIEKQAAKGTEGEGIFVIRSDMKNGQPV